jgi:hypothetical protein
MLDIKQGSPMGNTQANELTVRAGEVVRHDFAGTEVEVRGETASAAVAAREAAAIQARYVVAMRNPRNIDMFRDRLLHECKRPGFAAKAEYERPVGKEKKGDRWVDKTAKGPSIRFIEAALRCFGNVYPEVAVVYDSAALRICRASVTDLESNVTYTAEIAIDKQVEKRGSGRDGKEPPKGRDVISSRLNSSGELTFLVSATSDEVLVKQAALQSKAIRTLGQRLLPYDIVEEAILLTRKTVADQDAKDPDEAKRRVLDAFSELSVTAADLMEYLGHATDKITPAELTELRGIYTSIREGEASWTEIMAAKDPGGSKEAAEEVAKQKLAGLGRKKDQPAPTTTEAPKQEQPQSTEPTPEIPDHIKAAQKYADKIGQKRFMEICGACGVPEPERMTKKEFDSMFKELEGALADLNETKVEAPKPVSRLKFGQRPTE